MRSPQRSLSSASYVAARLEEARVMAVAARPSVVLVDRDLPRSAKLIILGLDGDVRQPVERFVATVKAD